MPILAPLALESPCLFAGFPGDIPCFAAIDGRVHSPAWRQAVPVAQGGLTAIALSAAGDCLFTGGEDGSVCCLNFPPAARADAAPEPRLVAHIKGKWIDCLAAAPQSGSFAFSCGRHLYFGTAARHGQSPIAGERPPLRQWQLERSAEGLDFAAKGLRLAVAHYNGASLYWPELDAPPQKLEWKGAHIGVTFSPDRRYLITTMQENALHGWRLEDGRHLRMSGYPAKIKSLSWAAKGRYLATSGAPAAILWPFISKDGPMNKTPLELGTRGDSMVTCVACHPQQDRVAIGYADGMILLARFTDTGERVLRRSTQGAITCLNWDKAGRRLAFGTESGAAGLANLDEEIYHQK